MFRPRADDPHVVRLEVSTGELVLRPQRSARITARAVWSDGAIRDVTASALYDSRDKQIAEVSEHGLISTKSPGRTPVTVRYMGQVSAVSVSFSFRPLRTKNSRS